MIRRNIYVWIAASVTALTAACGGGGVRPTTPSPVPTGGVTTANVYVLPGATNLGPNAFGDEAIVIHQGERMHWVNADGVAHNVTADTAAFPEFMETGVLATGDERFFLMETPGTTKIHCAIHPQETGTLVVTGR